MNQAQVRREVPVLKADAARQIVYGEVYVPDERDTHGHFMKAAEIEKMAHAFLLKYQQAAIDTEHDFTPNGAGVVESFVARPGDPDFTPGAWVIGVHVPDKALWAQLEKGELTGFSLAGVAELIPDKEGGEQ